MSRIQRLYRVVVDAWPTPDGLPLDRQEDEFWNDISYAFYNPSAADAKPWPEWLGDITDWFDDPGDCWSPPSRAYKAGHYCEDAGLVVPILRQRLWRQRAAAERKAADLRTWGCVVRVEASDPITWTEADS